MKRFFTCTLVALLTLCSVTTTSAQSHVTEGWSAKGGVGFYSYPDVVALLLVAFGTIVSGEDVEGCEFVPLLNISTDVGYQIKPWLRIGGALNMGAMSATRYNVTTDELLKQTRTVYPSLLFNAEFSYLQRERLSLYADVGVGAMALLLEQRGSEVDSSSGTTKGWQLQIAPAFDLYPLCISWGKDVGGMVELGWGTKGFVNAGAYFSF